MASECDSAGSSAPRQSVSSIVAPLRHGLTVLRDNWGYAVYAAWNFMLFYEPARITHSTDLFFGMTLYMLLASTASALLLSMGAQRLSPLCGKRSLMVAVGCIGSLGVAFIALATLGTLDFFWLRPGYALAGASSIFTVSAWLERFIIGGLDEVVWNYLVGTLAGAALYGIASVLPIVAGYIVFMAFPLAAAVQSTHDAHSITKQRPVAGKEAESPSPIIRLLIVVGLVFFAMGIVKAQAAGVGTSAFVTSTIWLSVLVQALASVLAKIIASYTYAFRTSVAFYIAIPAISLGSLLLVIGDGPACSLLVLALSSLSSQLVCFLVVFLIASNYERYGGSALLKIGLLNVVLSLGPTAGQLIASDFRAPTASALVVMGSMMLAALIVMGGASDFSIPASRSQNSEERRRAKIATISSRYGLTTRERDVLELWSQGHTSSYIEEHLSITKNTVKTHVSHIYSKTGTLSKEELLQLVEEFKNDKDDAV